MVYTTTLPPTGATTAQQVPAFAYTGDRTRAGAKLDLFRHQSIPNTFGTPDDWITWTPQFDHGGLIPNHARLDVRQYEWAPEPKTYRAILPTGPTVAQRVPTWVDRGGLTRDHAQLDVRDYAWDAAYAAEPTLPPPPAGSFFRRTYGRSVGGRNRGKL